MARSKKGPNGEDIDATRRASFLAHWLANGRNGRNSAIAVGVPEKSAATVASTWLKRPEMRAEIARIDNLALERANVTVERVVVELGRIGFVDVSQAFMSDGSIKPMKDWPDDVRRACVGFEVSEEQITDASGTTIGKSMLKKVKFHDKVSALDKLMKHFPDGYAAQRLDIKNVTDHGAQLEEARAYRAAMLAEREKLEAAGEPKLLPAKDLGEGEVVE